VPATECGTPPNKKTWSARYAASCISSASNFRSAALKKALGSPVVFRWLANSASILASVRWSSRFAERAFAEADMKGLGDHGSCRPTGCDEGFDAGCDDGCDAGCDDGDCATRPAPYMRVGTPMFQCSGVELRCPGCSERRSRGLRTTPDAPWPLGRSPSPGMKLPSGGPPGRSVSQMSPGMPSSCGMTGADCLGSSQSIRCIARLSGVAVSVVGASSQCSGSVIPPPICAVASAREHRRTPSCCQK
jgi:hypothetical protein